MFGELTEDELLTLADMLADWLFRLEQSFPTIPFDAENMAWNDVYREAKKRGVFLS